MTIIFDNGDKLYFPTTLTPIKLAKILRKESAELSKFIVIEGIMISTEHILYIIDGEEIKNEDE